MSPLGEAGHSLKCAGWKSGDTIPKSQLAIPKLRNGKSKSPSAIPGLDFATPELPLAKTKLRSAIRKLGDAIPGLTFGIRKLPFGNRKLQDASRGLKIDGWGVIDGWLAGDGLIYF